MGWLGVVEEVAYMAKVGKIQGYSHNAWEGLVGMDDIALLVEAISMVIIHGRG